MLRIGQADYHVQRPSSRGNLACLGPAQRHRDNLVEFLGMEIATEQLVAARDDVHGGQLARGFELNVPSPRNLAQHRHRLGGDGLHVGEFIPKDLEREVGTRACHDFIETELDRLGEHRGLPGNSPLQDTVHEFDQPRLGNDGATLPPPSLTGLKRDIGVCHVGAHRVAGDFGGANARKDMVDLRETLLQQGLGFLLQFHRGTQVQAGCPDELDADRAFVQLRDEVGAEPGEPDGGGHRGEQRHPQGEAAMREAPGQSWREEAPEPPDHPAFLAMAGWTEAKGSQSWHDRQRDERGSRQRDHHGRRHRLEHLPFDAFEGEDRDID